MDRRTFSANRSGPVKREQSELATRSKRCVRLRKARTSVTHCSGPGFSNRENSPLRPGSGTYVLEEGGGPGTEAENVSAMALLAKRGYTPEERTRLRELIETTRTIAPKPRLSEDDRGELLLQLYRWLTDWSAQAKQCIHSRPTLIRLGLARRRRRSSAADGEPDDQDSGEEGAAAAPSQFRMEGLSPGAVGTSARKASETAG